jgi:ribose transport system substrate-binding protein
MRSATSPIVIAAVALLLLATGVKAEEIGAVLAGTRGLFWQAVEKGIQQAGDELGVSVLIRSPVDDDAQTVREKLQIKMIDYVLRAGAKALILAPMPVDDIRTPIEYPVPVVLVDRPSDQFKAVSTIATDNYGGGRAGALSLRSRLPTGAKVGVLRLAPHVVSTMARETGFVEAAEEMGFEVVVDAYLGHGIREPQVAAATVLAPYQGRLDAVFTPTDNVALGVLRALQEWPRDKRPRVIAFDYKPGFEEYLRNGDLYAMVMQNPFKMGYTAVRQLMQYRSGQHVPETVMIDVLVVTADNIDDPKVQAVLRPYRE